MAPSSLNKKAEQGMAAMKQDEMILKTVKEIMVKFIEVGNISPSTFHNHFSSIYDTVEKSVKNKPADRQPDAEKK
jgi:hypothetical protein